MDIRLRKELEGLHGAKIVTYRDRLDGKGPEKPGGQCSCCGCAPDSNPDWRLDPWYIYHAGLVDSDGVYFSMLCEGCLEDIRHQVEKDKAKDGILKKAVERRQEQADILQELLPDDPDACQSMMEDLEYLDI